MTPVAWVLLMALVAVFVLFCFTAWALAERSVALVVIAENPHISGHVLSDIAWDVLGQTGARKFKPSCSPEFQQRP